MHHGVPARDDEESTVIPLRGRVLPEMGVPVVDLDDLNSPHTLAVLSIPPGSSVLDVGSGPGVVARALAARGCKVWGLEIDPRRAASARNYCIEVLEADVETVTLSAAFDGMAFDAVLFLDVLEHLRDPQAVLANAAAVLAPGGSVLLSIPNVTHGALRLELLSGRFRYRASGLLDRGHLRFFDAEAVDELIRLSGFRAETRLRVTRRLDQTEFDVDLARVPADLRNSLESDVDALTYQFFVIARPARGLLSAHEGLTLLERQRARIDELAAALEKGSAYARHLQEELAAKDARLREIEGGIASAERARFEELAAALEKGSAYARHLQEELAAKDARLRELETSGNAERARFEELATALEKGSAYARHLQEELTVRDARLRELETSGNAERARIEELAATVEKGGAYAARVQQELADTTARLRQAEGACVIVERELEAKAARLGEVHRAFGDIQGELEAKTVRLREIETAVEHVEREREASHARLAGMEQVVADLRRLSEDNDAYIRHLEAELRNRVGDIAIRDDEMSVLRTHIEKVEGAISERDREIADRDAALGELRARIAGAERSIADQEALRARIDEAGRSIADREARLQIAERSAAESRERASELSTVLQQPRHRVAEKGNAALKRWLPVLHRALRRLVVSPPPNDASTLPGVPPNRGAD